MALVYEPLFAIKEMLSCGRIGVIGGRSFGFITMKGRDKTINILGPMTGG